MGSWEVRGFRWDQITVKTVESGRSECKIAY